MIGGEPYTLGLFDTAGEYRIVLIACLVCRITDVHVRYAKTVCERVAVALVFCKCTKPRDTDVLRQKVEGRVTCR